ARYDLDSQPGRGWGAIGVEGLAPQFFRVGVTGYISGDGHLGAKLEGSYDFLFTQKLILQPQFEMNFYTKDDPMRGVGAGLSELDVGLRLRYEITRQFAPYIGVTYLGKFGNTANYVLQSGGNPNEQRTCELRRTEMLLSRVKAVRMAVLAEGDPGTTDRQTPSKEDYR
ncbi:copper resistance protein B domain protein, partial [Ostertagia ostertagi]